MEMRSAEDKVRFVLDLLSKEDVGKLREGEWLDLTSDVCRFVGWSSPRREEITPEMLRGIQKETFDRLVDVYNDIQAGHRHTGFNVTPEIGRIEIFATPDAGIQLSLRDAPLSDTFRFVTWQAFAALTDLSRLRRCLASDCQKFFYADDLRQVYHDNSCLKREGMRHLRAKLKAGKRPAKKPRRTPKPSEK